MDPEAFRRLGHELIDWIADYRQGIADRPVMAQVEPGDIKLRIPATPPLEAESLDDLFGEIERDFMPGLSHWQHPRFFGYFPANAPLESVLGDYLSTGLGVLGLSWQASPALTELEEVTADWVRQMVGLSARWRGVIQDTASTATLVALICARERATGYSLAGGGLQAEPRPLVVYASDQSHSSVEKAALLAGFGRANLRWIET
nr:aspartate aminotransferase family protein [Chloroflexia bacterium]